MPDLTTQPHYRISGRKRSAVALFLGAVAFAVVLGSAFQAMAGDADEQDDDPFESKIIKSILGNDKPAIDYRERSPLVVPPDSNLPPPEATNAVSSPNWPKDADNERLKKPKRKDPRDLDARTRFDPGRPLNPDELAGRTPGAGGVGAPTSQENAVNGRALSPGELGTKGNVWSNLWSSSDGSETAPYPGEPPRASLTDPPVGYLAPSPNYPYGVTPTKEAPKPFKVEDQAVGRQ